MLTPLAKHSRCDAGRVLDVIGNLSDQARSEHLVDEEHALDAAQCRGEAVRVVEIADGDVDAVG
jgi:hypothetical protein